MLCRAGQVRASDFDQFDYIFAMDQSNLSDLQRTQRQKPGSKAKLSLFGDYSGRKKAEVIDDPWYGGQSGFDKAYEQCVRFSGNFLKAVFPDIDPPS